MAVARCRMNAVIGMLLSEVPIRRGTRLFLDTQDLTRLQVILG